MIWATPGDRSLPSPVALRSSAHKRRGPVHPSNGSGAQRLLAPVLSGPSGSQPRLVPHSPRSLCQTWYLTVRPHYRDQWDRAFSEEQA